MRVKVTQACSYGRTLSQALPKRRFRFAHCWQRERQSAVPVVRQLSRCMTRCALSTQASPHFAGEADGVVAAGEISVWKNAQNLHQEQSLGTQPAGIPLSAPVKSHLDTDLAKPSAHGIHREGVGEGSLGRTRSMLTRLKLSTSPLFDLSASTCTATRCALR